MAKYKVETEKGNFMVETEDAPAQTSPESQALNTSLQQVNKQLAQNNRPQIPAIRPAGQRVIPNDLKPDDQQEQNFFTSPHGLIRTGLREALHGFEGGAQPGADAKFGAASNMLRGLGKAAIPAALPLAAANPLTALSGLAGGAVTDVIGKTTASALGAGPGASNLAGDVSGLMGGSVTAKALPGPLTKLFNLPAIPSAAYKRIPPVAKEGVQILDDVRNWLKSSKEPKEVAKETALKVREAAKEAAAAAKKHKEELEANKFNVNPNISRLLNRTAPNDNPQWMADSFKILQGKNPAAPPVEVPEVTTPFPPGKGTGTKYGGATEQYDSPSYRNKLSKIFSPPAAEEAAGVNLPEVLSDVITKKPKSTPTLTPKPEIKPKAANKVPEEANPEFNKITSVLKSAGIPTNKLATARGPELKAIAKAAGTDLNTLNKFIKSR